MKYGTLHKEPGDCPSCWVYSSYAVDPDEESHCNISDTQKRHYIHSISHAEVQDKNSTEAKFVAIDDSMVQVLWTKLLLSSHVVCEPTTTIYQDKKSTILQAENYKNAISRRTKHLDIHYFLHDRQNTVFLA